MEIIGIREKKGFSFTWAIENFSYCWQKNGESISSPDFIVDTMAKTKWTLVLYPKGNDKKTSDFIAIYLRRQNDSKGPEKFEIFLEFSILDSNESVLVSTAIYKVSAQKNTQLGIQEFVRCVEVFKVRRKDFLPEDVLTIRCRMWILMREVTIDGHCFARTRIGIERRSFVWNIKRFSCFQKSLCEITSVTKGNLIMLLNFLPNTGETSETLIHVVVCTEDQRIKFSTLLLHVLCVSGSTIECLREESVSNENVLKLTLSKEKLMEDKTLYLPNDVLTLSCECVFVMGIVLEEVEKISYGCFSTIQKRGLINDNLEFKLKTLDSTNILVEHLESTFKENLLCDTKLMTTTGRPFPCHKYILSARSPVFKAMFTNDMRESNSDCVLIEDLSDDTVSRLLLYIYTATVQDLQWDSASQLYTAADKYEILSLKKECSSFFKDNLYPDNACDLLILADMHQDQELKSAAQDYILNHRAIFRTNEWKDFMKTNSQLAADLMYLTLKD